jgi:hypothetical protein
VLEWVSIPIAIIALVASLYSLWRVERFRNYDYAVRLQLESPEDRPSVSIGTVLVEGDTPEKHHDNLDDPFVGLHYVLRNAGKEPVEVTGLWIEFGKLRPTSSRESRKLTGRTYLSPGDRLKFKYEVTRRNIIDARHKYKMAETDPCAVVLRVKFVEPGRKREREVFFTLQEFEGVEMPVFYLGGDRAVT